jgi:hypothetical protein
MILSMQLKLLTLHFKFILGVGREKDELKTSSETGMHLLTQQRREKRDERKKRTCVRHNSEKYFFRYY